MPYGVLLLKPGVQSIGHELAPQLPEIVASALTLEEKELHEGKVTPSEILILPVCSARLINGKDIEFVILAHNFPERVENLGQRKAQILAGMHEALFRMKVSGITIAVCIVTGTMAYGEIKLG